MKKVKSTMKLLLRATFLRMLLQLGKSRKVQAKVLATTSPLIIGLLATLKMDGLSYRFHKWSLKKRGMNGG